MTGKTLRGNQRTLTGFTLIEVLIALVVMTVGMLGLSAIYIESLRLNRSAIYHNAAISLAADMAERMRASGHVRPDENERVAWEREVRKRLPNGSKMNIRLTPFVENGSDPDAGRHDDIFSAMGSAPEIRQLNICPKHGLRKAEIFMEAGDAFHRAIHGASLRKYGDQTEQ